MIRRHIRTDTSHQAPYGGERDACAIYLSARRHGQSTFGTLARALRALTHMGHRTGFVNGEGDGAGVQTDIPRRLWAGRLSQAGLRSALAIQPGFWVGHLFVAHGADYREFRDEISRAFQEADLNLLVEQPGQVRPEALGRLARQDPASFWQLAGYVEEPDVEKRLFATHTQLESQLPVHFASLSSYSVVYKVRGSIQMLPRYYPDLQDRSYDTSLVLCHARYSTNTHSNFERAQPFPLLGHNGEINTINRFRQEAEQIHAVLPVGGSDSQHVDRVLHTLCVEYGLDLCEAMELIFPPVPYELDWMPPATHAVYTRLRQAFGPYAQGPAAIIARYGNMAVLSVDALGLRPLWFCETEKEYIFSSERGAIPLEALESDPRALAPGEKIAIRVNHGVSVEVWDHTAMRQHVMSTIFQREAPQLATQYWTDLQAAASSDVRRLRSAQVMASRQQQAADPMIFEPAQHPWNDSQEQPFPHAQVISTGPVQIPWRDPEQRRDLTVSVLAAMGWQREHVQEIAAMSRSSKDPVGSLGYDGPLAILSKRRVNLADFFKETVAVVTNPSIDRGREREVFSTSVLVGARPAIGCAPDPDDLLVELHMPILPGGHPSPELQGAAQEVAQQLGTLTIEELLSIFGERSGWLTLGVFYGERVEDALERLAHDAIEAVRGGAQCILIDDTETLAAGLGWLDPHLATACVHEALRTAGDSHNLRRRAGIVVRSASIRTLHDVILLCGLGADAVNPYAMLAVALDAHEEGDDTPQGGIQRQLALLGVLRVGLEKVISTIGCHELRGYGRVFGAIGLAPSVSQVFKTPNYLGSEEVGMNWVRLNKEARLRAEELRGEGARSRLENTDRFYPKFWKKVGAFARGEIEYDALSAQYQRLAEETPVALRHVLDIRRCADSIDPAEVDIGIGGYDLPVVIAAMSFGSQGERSYRAYAHAAAELNIICLNGEGGELPEMLGQYTKHRGQQVASGRFGVNAGLLNSAAVIEIKIGQGAKPGEGGMLPGDKVTPQVALARHTTPFVSLLSPSNNHDLYSIEDLAQLIEELKTVSPYAKIAVKCPVVPDIGVIAVGVAKAGADIINLTGYDGGTGAARKHAIQYVGLPAEIGVIQAHRALIDAGIRHRVELWCDGGMKTGSDVVKMILLGANRVGFGTMAMVAVGCTICRKCDEGRCHRGITTHVRTVEEAQDQSITGFTPLDDHESVSGLKRVFGGIGEEIRQLTAQLGATCLQDLVGRADLLEQKREQNTLDLSAMCEASPIAPRPAPVPGVGRLITRPRNNLTRLMSELILNAVHDDEREVTYRDEVTAIDRALGSHLAGEVARNPELRDRFDCLHLRFGPASIAGNGFAAWAGENLDVLIEGGAQDGVGKGLLGGRIAVMKGLNHEGQRVDGGVGKSFAYGAQEGILIVQGNTDSRACIRLSGADVILGAELTEPIDNTNGSLSKNANMKGFACEYMTAGRVLIMGDPGPYAFAGMTGGVVYQLLTPELGLTAETIKRRTGHGANVSLKPIDSADVSDIQELLGYYIEALDQTGQYDVVTRIGQLCQEDVVLARFIKIVANGA